MIGIDLGSNTLRACKIDEKNEICWDFERIVGSARDMSEAGLADPAKERIKGALRELKASCELKGQYFAAATAAFRKAKNAKDFLTSVKNELGIEFEIISADLEGKLAQMAIISRLKALGLDGSQALFIDLGGASTEISFGKELKSFDFGIVSFVNSFGCDFSKAVEITKSAKKFIADFDVKLVVLSSGVPTSVAALKLGIPYKNYNAKLINGLKLELADFSLAAKKISTCANADELIGANRSDIMLAGCALMGELLRDLKSLPFVAIDDGLREGLCAGIKNKIILPKEF